MGLVLFWVKPLVIPMRKFASGFTVPMSRPVIWSLFVPLAKESDPLVYPYVPCLLPPRLQKAPILKVCVLYTKVKSSETEGDFLMELKVPPCWNRSGCEMSGSVRAPGELMPGATSDAVLYTVP